MVPLAASACRTRNAAVTPATLPLVSAFLAEIRVVHQDTGTQGPGTTQRHTMIQVHQDMGTLGPEDMGVGTAGALRPEEGTEVAQVLATSACRTRNAAVNLAT